MVEIDLVLLCEEGVDRCLRRGASSFKKGMSYLTKLNFSLAFGYARYMELIPLMSGTIDLMRRAGISSKEMNKWKNRGYEIIKHSLKNNRLEKRVEGYDKEQSNSELEQDKLKIFEQAASDFILSGIAKIPSNIGEARVNFRIAYGLANYTENLDLINVCHELLKDTGLSRKEIQINQNQACDIVRNNSFLNWIYKNYAA